MLPPYVAPGRWAAVGLDLRGFPPTVAREPLESHKRLLRPLSELEAKRVVWGLGTTAAAAFADATNNLSMHGRTGSDVSFTCLLSDEEAAAVMIGRPGDVGYPVVVSGDAPPCCTKHDDCTVDRVVGLACSLDGERLADRRLASRAKESGSGGSP
jgi:hypothetical protein